MVKLVEVVDLFNMGLGLQVFSVIFLFLSDQE